MLLEPIHTQKLKVNLRFTIEYRQPLDLDIMGVDADDRHTTFFHRIANNPHGAGNFVVDFPMPLSPDRLLMRIINRTTGSDADYIVRNVAAEWLPQKAMALTQDEIQFLDFFTGFSLKASHQPYGIYRIPGCKYWINYMPVIIDDELGEIDTPARIDHGTLEIQIAGNQFRNMPVTRRIVIGVHEFTHPNMNTKDETLCDLNACRLCLGLRFPATEIVYAFTSIFGNDAEAQRRIRVIENYILQHKTNGIHGRF